MKLSQTFKNRLRNHPATLQYLINSKRRKSGEASIEIPANDDKIEQAIRYFEKLVKNDPEPAPLPLELQEKISKKKIEERAYQEKLRKFREYWDEKCEESNSLTEVGPEYYQEFLDLDEKSMREIIFEIIDREIDRINDGFAKHKWNDDKYHKFIASFLQGMAVGMFALCENSICICKPVGPPPSDEMKERIQRKIDRSIPLMDEILEKLVEYTKHLKEKPSSELQGDAVSS